MTEYIIILAMVAIAAIGLVTVFGDDIRALFGASNDTVAGDVKGSAERPRPSGTEAEAPESSSGDHKGSGK